MRALAFLPWAVPGLVAALGWRWLLDEQSGAVNAWLIGLGLVVEPVDWLSDPQMGMFSIGARDRVAGAAVLHHDVRGRDDDGPARAATRRPPSTARAPGRGCAT